MRMSETMVDNHKTYQIINTRGVSLKIISDVGQGGNGGEGGWGGGGGKSGINGLSGTGGNGANGGSVGEIIIHLDPTAKKYQNLISCLVKGGLGGIHGKSGKGRPYGMIDTGGKFGKIRSMGKPGDHDCLKGNDGPAPLIIIEEVNIYE